MTWNQSTFDKLIDAEPETLVPHLKITHSMVLNEVAQGGDARARIDDLIDDSAQTPDQKEHLHQRADEISKPCSIPKSSKPRTARTAARTTT